MNDEGPPLEQLTRRLTDTPQDFLDEPRIGNRGRVHVAAVVGDLVRSLGGSLSAEHIARLQSNDAQADRNRLSITLIVAWLMADPWFRNNAVSAQASEALMATAQDLAAHVLAPKFVSEPDRREELARTALTRLGLRPAGESAAQAQDRLTTISTAERQRVIAASRQSEARARTIREALAKRAAEESADKWSRE